MMSEAEAILELKSMTQEELDLVQFDEVKWICAGKNCNRGTNVRDYGIGPTYYHKRMKWVDITKEWIACAKHWKIYKRLIKKFPIEKVHEKIFDHSKNKIITGFKKVNKNKG